MAKGFGFPLSCHLASDPFAQDQQGKYYEKRTIKRKKKMISRFSSLGRRKQVPDAGGLVTEKSVITMPVATADGGVCLHMTSPRAASVPTSIDSSVQQAIFVLCRAAEYAIWVSEAPQTVQWHDKVGKPTLSGPASQSRLSRGSSPSS